MHAIALGVYDSTEIEDLSSSALKKNTNDREFYLRGIDASFAIEGLSSVNIKDIDIGK